ncbi:hypothetical protein K438DRAFT_1992604 [Mycena galopus ATCC 62051]|nr:hypothetical protein K438DRAFT_1992604 [Mycena galopus ATCC 62051]
MTTHSFKLLTDEEVLDFKRTTGVMACAECQKNFRAALACDEAKPTYVPQVRDIGFIGRGRRILGSETRGLITVMQGMGDRIQDLETALAQAHSNASDSTHPLLRDEFLGIKSTKEIPRASTSNLVHLASTCGALAVNASGTPHYFGFTAGPSALLSLQGSSGGDRAAYAPPFSDTVHSFPLDSDDLWDTDLCREILLGQLPGERRAWALYDIFVGEASWYGTPLMSDELQELLDRLYRPNSSTPEPPPHTLALVFLAFAHAALMDLSLPAYNSEADTYFDLARTALSLHSVFESDELHTIQVLALAGLYHATGGPRYSLESAWTMNSMALAPQLHLHLESEHTHFENETAQRRRALFWEIYSLHTYQSLAFARPLAILPTDISCELPADKDQESDDEGRTIPGYFRTRWNFTKEVTAPMAQAYTSAKPPTYEEVLNLDRRLRQFMERAPFTHYRQKARETNTLLTYVRAHIIPRFAANLMIYIHRGSFIQALKDRPLDPLGGPYAASFLASYRGASLIIESDIQSFFLFTEHFHRWWPVWKGLVNASFIVGSIVAKSPTVVMAAVAFSELVHAVELIGRGATHSFVAAGSLPILRRLQNRAAAAYTAARPFEAPLHSAHPSDLADEKDFELLSGSHAMLNRESLSKPYLIPSAGPALVLDAPPTQLPDAWLNFPFTPVPVLSGHCADGTAAADLEDYLDAQMRVQSESPFPPKYCSVMPRSEAEWATFLSILEY